MLFFRTISLVAALAFATLSSAIPVEGAGLVASGDVFARDVSELSLPLKRGVPITDLYNTCHNNVVTIIADIHVAVAAGNNGAVLSCLNDIIVEINILIDAVPGAVVVGIEIQVFAGIVCGLIQLILEVLNLVLHLSVEITACVNIIGGLLGTLVHLTLGIVVGLEVVLVVLLHPLSGLLGSLGLLNIFIGIGISL